MPLMQDKYGFSQFRLIAPLTLVLFLSCFQSYAAEVSTHVEPFDPVAYGLEDQISGPRILNFQTIPKRGWSGLHPELTYLSTHSRSSIKSKVGLEITDHDQNLFSAEATGLVPLRSEDDETVDDDMVRRLYKSNGFLFRDKEHQVHNLQFWPGDMKLSSLRDIDGSLECATIPQPINVRWDGKTFTVIVGMKAVYAPDDGIFNYEDASCVQDKRQTRNSKFAPLAGGGIIVSDRNIYFSSLHSVYVIPVDYFSPSNLGKQNIVFKLDDFYRELSYSHTMKATSRNCGEDFPATPTDCVQAIIDQALTRLTEQKR